MPNYRVNNAAVKQAKKLIDDGKFDDRTPWSDAAPDAADSNDDIDKDSFEEFANGTWRSTPTPRRGRRRALPSPTATSEVNRAALIHAKQRASQNDHDEIEKAADEVLGHLDGKRG